MIGDPVFPKRSRWYWPLLVALAKEADQCISLKRKQLAIPSGRAGEGRGDENRSKNQCKSSFHCQGQGEMADHYLLRFFQIDASVRTGLLCTQGRPAAETC